MNIRWAREAGFTTGFVFLIVIAALRSLNLQFGLFTVTALVMLWFCVFAVFYRSAKRHHS